MDVLPEDRLQRAWQSLLGLSLGDALGSQFFVPANRDHLASRSLPPGPWQWTDDTEMACSVYLALAVHGTIDQDLLAASFARRHDFDRGYGPAANRMLRLVRDGGDWRSLAAGLFDGSGSWGNGAAMRVAPLGAFFADDPAEAARQAALSAAVTHTHPEAVAGAIAVAAAAAHAASGPLPPGPFIDRVLEHVPSGKVRDGIMEARRMLTVTDPETVAYFLGNGRDYYLTNLEIYADGSIFCWEWVDLAGLKSKLASGWVATSFEAGARASAHHLASWRFEEPQSWVKPEWLLGEVADEIEKLNGRPDSTDRCLLALDRYLQGRSETVDAVSYPTVVHAYWALAVADPVAAEQIRTADRPYDAEKLAGQSAIRPDWPAVRMAAMARLLRAKFTQHPHLAEILLGTGDGRIEYTSLGSGYWNAGRGKGRNWMGRLLELIRSEVAAQQGSSLTRLTP